MAIHAVCECGKQYKLRNEPAERDLTCPACGAMLTVPARASHAAPASDANLTSALDLAAASEKTAKQVAVSKPASTNAFKIIMAIVGVVGAAATRK